MNKKAFIGATLITATVVAGAVYYRHKILAQVDKWLDDVEEHQGGDAWATATESGSGSPPSPSA